MTAPAPRLGLRENLPQFSLLVRVNAFVVWVVAALTAASGVVVLVRLRETLRPSP